ncbi:MAG: OadG family transporter subunit [Atribacterota bacterium]
MYVGLEGAIKIAITVIILVFIILSLLALLMIGLREIVKLSSRKQAEEKKIKLSGKEKVRSTTSENSVVQNKEEDDVQLIAAISAAISIFMSKPITQIKIINIKRTVPAEVSPWTISGKQNLMSNRVSISSRKRGGF